MRFLAREIEFKKIVFYEVHSEKEIKLGKFFVVLFAVLCFTGCASTGAGFDSSAKPAGPTKQVIEPAQGLEIAQARCPKYAGDEVAEVSCVLFHLGVITKANGKYVPNLPLLNPIKVNTEQPAGTLVECTAEFAQLADGTVGWVNDSKCRYRDQRR